MLMALRPSRFHCAGNSKQVGILERKSIWNCFRPYGIALFWPFSSCLRPALPFQLKYCPGCLKTIGGAVFLEKYVNCIAGHEVYQYDIQVLSLVNAMHFSLENF